LQQIHRRVCALPTALGLALFTCLEMASSSPAAPPDDDWHLQTSFNIWATSLDGKVGVRNLESDVNVDFSDLFDKSAFAFNPVIELSKGDWVFGYMGSYSKLEDERTFDDGRGGAIDMYLGVFDFSLGYTLVRTQLGEMPFTFTPAVGAQVTYMKIELNPNNFATLEDDKTWVDPYLAARVVLGITPTIDWRTQGSIGGFGVSSDLT
jgi:hypothetical protein